jgi:hypothetical protein
VATAQPEQEARANTSTDVVLIVGAILMCAGAAATAILFALLVNALPAEAYKGIVFVALMLIGSTLVNYRLRSRLIEEKKTDARWFTAFIFLTQFFLALAWVALMIAGFVLTRI